MYKYSEGVFVDISSEKTKTKFEQAKDELIDILKIAKEERTEQSEIFFINFLLNEPINNEDDLKRILFAYNNGNLRTYSDLYFYDKQKKHKFFLQNFNLIRHLINILCLVGPSGFVLWKTIKTTNHNIVLIPLDLILSLLAAYVGGLVGYTVNIALGKSYGLTEEDTRMYAEITKRRAGFIAGIFGGISVGRHTKKAVKDITNVDGWKEMK